MADLLPGQHPILGSLLQGNLFPRRSLGVAGISGSGAGQSHPLTVRPYTSSLISSSLSFLSCEMGLQPIPHAPQRSGEDSHADLTRLLQAARHGRQPRLQLSLSPPGLAHPHPET